MGKTIFALALSYIGITKLLLCQNKQLQSQFHDFTALLTFTEPVVPPTED